MRFYSIPRSINDFFAFRKTPTLSSPNLHVRPYNTHRDTSGTASPLISARYQTNNPSNQSSPTRLPNNRDHFANDAPLPFHSSLARQDSGSLSADDGRRPRSRSPAKPAGSRVLAERTDSDAPSGLDFLLQACDMLEPDTTSRARPVGRPARRNGGTRPSRYSEDGEYTPADSSEDEDYRPSRGDRKGRRSQNLPLSRYSAPLSAAPVAAVAMPRVVAAPTVKWERGMVHGPCTNPDCEHPEDSPQWRKGPPQHPVLCNACGTRWLRNGTLKPLVVS
jgi:GATA zinc finger